MNQKKIALTIGIALILAVAGVLVWQKKDAPQSEQTVQKVEQPLKTDEIESVRDLIDGEYAFTPIDTSDWKTYRDNDARFQMRLPKNFEKTDQGFTPKTPPIGSLEDIENNVWFLAETNSRLKQKKLSDIFQKDLFGSSRSPLVGSDNMNVSAKQATINNISMVLVKSIFGRGDDGLGGWIEIEGAYEEESFFECGSDMCSLKISSHQYSDERQALFYTVLATLHLIK